MKFLCIFKKELRVYFGSFIAYALSMAFLLLVGYFFYTDMIFYDLFGHFTDITTALWQYYFQDLRFLSLLMLPLLTMRLFAEEKNLGTLELLWTYPLTDRDIILGKFLASLCLFALMLIATLFPPAILYTIHPFSWGPPLSGYLGLLLLGASFIACGTFISSLTENQLVSAMSTYAVLVSWWFLTWNEEAVGEQFLGMSLFDRFEPFTTGVLNTKDVFFFILVTLFFLYLTLQSLESRKWHGIRSIGNIR
jgi:ABC-2 type transport system permease protein